MAKNILMHQWDKVKNDFEEIHPVTRASNVLDENGNTFENHMKELFTQYGIGEPKEIKNFDSLDSGFYYAEPGATNAPTSDGHFVVFVARKSSNAGSQIAVERFDGEKSNVYVRSEYNGLYSRWKELLGKDDFDSHKSDYAKHPAFATTSNSGNDYSVTLDPVPSSYTDGMGIVLKPNADSNGDVTVNVNGLGATPVKKADGEVFKEFKKGGVYTLRYSGGNFILQGEGGVSKSAQISNLSVNTGFSTANKVELTWKNPSDDKFKGVVIRFKENGYPNSPNDGYLFYDSNDNTPKTVHSVTDNGLKDGTKFYFRAFAYTYENATRKYTDTESGAITEATPSQTQGRKEFTSSTIWTVPYGVENVEVFLVGGGGGSGYTKYNVGYSQTPGAGGGYTKTANKKVNQGQRISVAVGSGGNRSYDSSQTGESGGNSSFGDISVKGGQGGGSADVRKDAGDGGSGGGFNGDGGSDGSDGKGDTYDVGSGQGKTTREFEDANGTLYAGGGASGNFGSGDDYKGGKGGGGNSGVSGSDNTGGGAGGGHDDIVGGSGGSGIVIVRWGWGY